jgi:O-antigen ligase
MLNVNIVRFAALFWGLVVFMPVGLNYLAFFLLIALVLMQQGLGERWARLRGHILWWPLVVYVVWTLLILAVMPTYPETPSNLFHALRIAVTLALTVMLTREEAIWGVRGFAVAAVLSLAALGLHQLIGFPDAQIWHSLINHSGNKSIANAVQFSLIAASLLLVALDRPGLARNIAVPAVLVLLSIPVWVLSSRTSLLIFVVGLAAACIHQWRSHKLMLAASLAVALIATGVMFSAVPRVKERFAMGITEIEAAHSGKVSQESWGVRVNMYRHTANMVLERPLTGWGIGAWTSQWKQRVPPVLAEFNMPHNDFLWMGAQAGIPGALALLSLLGAGLWAGWRRTDLTGRLAFTAMLTVLLTTSVNTAMRDAALGLSLLWIAGLYLRMAAEPEDAVTLLHSPFAGKHHSNRLQQNHPIHPQ